MNAEIKYQRLPIAFVLINFFAFNTAFSQTAVLNNHELIIIKNISAYKSSAKNNPAKQMVDIKNSIPNILLDLRYTTGNNFMHQKLYSLTATTFLRSAAANALSQIQKKLNEQGLGLKIFDAYRPYSVTKKMWELIKDDRYVADPKKGSGHNRGIAVDVTIINLKTNVELRMGTGFDSFSDTAHQTFTALPEEVLQNRNLLKKLMEEFGFKPLETEWWHYSLPNANDFEVLDLSFKKLKKLND